MSETPWIHHGEVGYGDLYPESPMGRIVASITAFLGQVVSCPSRNFPSPKIQSFSLNFPFCRDFLQFIMWPYDLGLSVLNLSVSFCKNPLKWVVCRVHSPKVEILWAFDVSSIAALLVPFGGIGLFALPAGIITAGFRNEQLRRHPSKHHGNVIDVWKMRRITTGSVLGCSWLCGGTLLESKSEGFGKTLEKASELRNTESQQTSWQSRHIPWDFQFLSSSTWICLLFRSEACTPGHNNEEAGGCVKEVHKRGSPKVAQK